MSFIHKCYITKINLLAIVLGFSLCFAQETTPRIAVYVTGEESTSKINRTLSVKLSEAMTQNSSYAVIENPEWFQNGLAKGGKIDLASLARIAKRRGADYICEVNITMGFGTLYSITAHLVRTFDLQEIKTAYADNSIESMEDLTTISNELASQLLLQEIYMYEPPYITAEMANSLPPEEITPAPAPRRRRESEPQPAPPPPAPESEDKKNKESSVSFGIRAGANFSHTWLKYSGFEDISGNYGDILGMQAGFVVDFSATRWLHIQPGLMYIQKGMEDGDGSNVTAHHIELPLLISLKLAALRLNAGPYFSICLDSDYSTFKKTSTDLGISAGIGFDIGIIYIGAFYDYGFFDMSNKSNFSFYNRTLGLNFGINL